MVTRTVTTLPSTSHYEVGRLWDGHQGNFDHQRTDHNLIVIHTMDGTVDGSTAWFAKQNTSAHYGVGMTGEITAWIPEDCVAYHAGKYPENQRSFGIEHEDDGDESMVRADALYESSAKLVEDISFFYSIPLDRDHIKKHNEIVSTACPGTLDIDRIVNRARILRMGRADAIAPAAVHVEEDAAIRDMLVTKANSWDTVGKYFGLNDIELTQVGKANQVLSEVDSLKSRLQTVETKLSQAENTVTFPADSSQSTLSEPQVVSTTSTSVLQAPSDSNIPTTQANLNTKINLQQFISAVKNFIFASEL